MAKKKDEAELRDGPHDGSSRVHTDPGQEPGPDVSNADVNMSTVSLDSAHATVEPAPEQNPEGHVPPPGPQYVQVLGGQQAVEKADEDTPVSAQVRPDGGGQGVELPEPELPDGDS